jgi:predicted dehydrogenase
MVGFNRRFAPHIVKLQELLRGAREPKALIMTVNAGAIPADHWTRDPERGGGRIIGEACHVIDLLRFLAGSAIASTGVTRLSGDTVSIALSFADGSTGTVHYLANGHRSFPKERLEVFCGGRILQLDNFRTLRGYGWRGFRKMSLWRQDKGHAAAVAAFLGAVRQGKPSPIPLEEAIEVTRATFQVA